MILAKTLFSMQKVIQTSANNVKCRENIDTKGKRKQHLKPDSEPSVKQCRDSYLEKESDLRASSSHNSELSLPLSIEVDFTSTILIFLIFSCVLRSISIRSV